MVNITDDEDDEDDTNDNVDDDYDDEYDTNGKFKESDILKAFKNVVTDQFNKEEEINNSVYNSNNESEDDSDIDEPIFSGTKDDRVLSDVSDQGSNIF